MKRSTLSLLVPLLFALVLPSCSAKTKDPDLRRRAAAIPILTPKEIGDREYEILERVVGLSCAGPDKMEPDMDEARQHMRIDAAVNDADAIANSFCEDASSSFMPTQDVRVSFMPHCTVRIECSGDAIRWIRRVPSRAPPGLGQGTIPIRGSASVGEGALSNATNLMGSQPARSPVFVHGAAPPCTWPLHAPDLVLVGQPQGS